MDLKHLIQLLTLAAIWGSSFLFMRIGVPVFGPAFLIGLRVFIAAVILVAAIGGVSYTIPGTKATLTPLAIACSARGVS